MGKRSNMIVVDKTECWFYAPAGIHPANTGPRETYICRHPAWIQTQKGDFEPVAKCCADIQHCDLAGYVRRLYKEAKDAKYYYGNMYNIY